jgi:cytochrome c556
MKSKLLLASFSLVCLCVSCSPPVRNLTEEQIRRVDNYQELMWVLGTVADPCFKLAKTVTPEAVTDAHFAEFTDMGRRVHVTAQRLPEFSKQKLPELARRQRFDGLTQNLASDSERLEKVAAARQAPKTLQLALQVLDACKACHQEFRRNWK